MKTTILPLPILIALKLLVAIVLGVAAYQKLRGAEANLAHGATGEQPAQAQDANVATQESDSAATPNGSGAAVEKSDQSYFDRVLDLIATKEEPVAKTAMQETKKESKDAGQLKVPDLPPAQAGLADLAKARRQLEMLHKEVEEKIVRLKLATENFDLARKDSEEKLRIIKEEKQLLEETLQKEKELQKERIEEALAFIEKMEPKKAAPVLEQMDRDLVIALFKKLKPKTVTKFLEGMKASKATEYMEYYTKIRSGREYELLRDLKMCQDGDAAEQNFRQSSDRKDEQAAEQPLKN